jgi:hypothetical protein
MIFGKPKHSSFGIHTAPVPPDCGPAKIAVLAYEGRRVMIGKVLECCERANLAGLVGATVTCLGSTEPCARIARFDWGEILALNSPHLGGHPSVGLNEAQLLIA